MIKYIIKKSLKTINMKTIVVLYAVLFLVILSCRKDKPIPTPVINIPAISAPNNPVPPCIGDYNLYSNDTFSYVFKDLINTYPTGPDDEFPQEYLYGGMPVFNPHNPYEFIYTKVKSDFSSLENEIWKFSFCTGVATQIASNFYYNIDWGSNGWIIYTGTGHRIYKVKDNGDSLTMLSTETGYNRAGKWNPSGTLYTNERDDGLFIKDQLGNTVKVIYYKALEWLDDSTILFSDYNANYSFSSYNINTDVITSLNTNWVSGSTTYTLNRYKNTCYVPIYTTGIDDYFLEYDLNGSNAVDTICQWYNSYKFYIGDMANDKLIATFNRIDWKDSLVNSRYQWYNIAIMDLDATNVRIVNLP